MATINAGASLTAISVIATNPSSGFTGEGSNINVGTVANQIVTTTAGGKLTTQSTITTAQGGVGTDLSVLPAGSLVTDGVGNITSVAYSQGNASNTLVQRDVSGNITSASLYSKPIGLLTGEYSIRTSFISTNNNTPTTLYTLPTSSTATPGQKSTNYVIEITVSYGEASGLTENNSGFISMIVKARNTSGTLTIGTPLMLINSSDTALSTCAVNVSNSGTNVIITVTGIVGMTINWFSSIRITQVIH